MSEQAMENVQVEADSKKKKKGLLVLVLAIALLGAIAFWFLASGGIIVTGEARSLIKELKKDGTATIVLDKDVVVNGPMVVNGKKTITGSGKITMHEKAKIDWPELEEIKSFSGVGCVTVKTHDTSEMPAMFVVSPKAELTIAGSVGADAAKICNVCQVQETGSFTIKEKATIENGRYCNIDVQEKAEFTIKGGNSLNGTRFNVINKGTSEINGGKISGTEDKTGALIYSTSKLSMSDGTAEKSAGHNIYVASGEFEMTGGESSFSRADGIVIKQDAVATITGGTMEAHTKHGIHNDGKTTIGKVKVLESGISNGPKGVLEVDGANVRSSYIFALSNEGGTVKAKNFSTKNCEAIAICNLSGEMELTDINLQGGRDGNISIITGKVSMDRVTLDKCRGTSVSISGGKVDIKNLEVQGTSGKYNGVYVYGGELTMADTLIHDTGDCGFRVDRAGFAEIKNITIKDTGSTAVFGGGGTLNGENIDATNIGGHGVYNTGGKVTLSNFNIKTVTNVIQQRNGETVLNNITADDMELGAYCQEGILTINGGKFTNSKSNGLRVKEKTTGDLPTLVLNDVVISDVKFHGISNMGIFKGNNVTIKNAGMNGFYNKETGKATVKGLKVSNITDYGISNAKKATLNSSNVTVENVGKTGKNAVHNVGTMTVKGLTIKNNQKNGIYNVGKMSGSDITVSNIKDNGIYNNTDTAATGFKGYFNVTNVTVHDTGSQGVTNMREATLKVKNLVVYNVPENGVRNHNSGIADIDGGKIYNVDKHGINNDKSTLKLSNFEIYDVNRAGREFNLLNNSGKLTGSNINLHGKAFRALYSNSLGTVSITGLKADGAGLSNVTVNGKVLESKCVVSNNGGVMTLKDSKITNAKEMALYLISGSKTTLNGVTIDKATTHGISSQGNTTIASTNLTIKNTPGTALYNNGVMTSKNLVIDNCSNGVSCRGNGRLTLAGNTTVTNTKAKAIQTWGDEKKSNDNRIAVAENAKVLIDGTGDHALLNRGQFLMYKSATLTVKNVEGTGSNAIYNYNHPDTGVGTPVMKLGKVQISEIKSVANDATVVGDAIANRGDMTLLGDVTVSGIHASGSSMGTDRNYAGIMNMNGTIKGTANVTVTGEATEGAINEDTLVCGVFVEGGTVSLGDITVKNARSHGIQIKKGTLKLANGADVSIDTTGKHAILNASSFLMDKTSTLTVKNVGGTGSNAIYNYDFDGDTTPVMTLGTVTVEGINVTSTGRAQGNAVANRGDMTLLGDVTVSGIHGSGGSVNSNANYAGVMNYTGTIKGNANVTVNGDATEGVPNADTMSFGVYVREGEVNLGTVTVKNARQRAIHLGDESKAATLNAKDIIVDTSTDRGIYIINAGSKLNTTDSVSVNKTGNQGFYIKEAEVSVGKDISVSNVSITGTNGANALYAHTNAKLTVGGNVTIDGMSGTTANENQGNGMIVDGSATVGITGNVTVKNVTAGGYANTGCGNGIFSRGNTTIGGDVVVDNVATGHAVAVTAKKVTMKSLTVTNAIAKPGVYVKSNGTIAAEAEINGGQITGAYPKDIGVVTAEKSKNAKLTLKNFKIVNSGASTEGLKALEGAILNAENVTVEGCGASVNDADTQINFAGTNAIKNYNDYGIKAMNGQVTLADNAVLTISHEGEGVHKSGIYMASTASITGANATINIQNLTIAAANNGGIFAQKNNTITLGTLNVSNIAGTNGYGIRLKEYGVNGSTGTMKIGTMNIQNTAKKAIYSNKAVNDSNIISIGALTVTGCADDNQLTNIGANCYTLVTP